MKNLIQFLFTCFGLSFFLIFSGCSVAGLGIGAIVDSSSKKNEYSADSILTIPVKSQVNIILNNGERRKGQYILYTVSMEDENKLTSITCYKEFAEEYFVTPVADINKVLVKPKRKGWALGLGIGAGLDIIAIISLRDLDFSGGSWFKFDEE